MKTFNNLFHLSSSVEIIVPSTTNVDVVDETLYTDMVQKVSLALSELFGGATAINAIGSYKANNGSLVTEKVTVVQAFTDSKTLEKSADSVLNLCQDLCRKMTQESIALKVNGVLYFVEK